MSPSLTPDVAEAQPMANKDLEVTKYSLRKEIWTAFDKNGLVTFPRPVRGRIPNFVGAGEAAEKLKNSAAFQNAKVIKVNADKPQETVRVYALEAKDKRLVVSPRRNDSNALMEIKLPEPPMGTEPSPAVLRAAVTRKGMITFSHPLQADQGIKIDLIVVGSVAVSRQGQRIGKCDGFSDLEFGYLSEIGVIDKDTIIATTVHDTQVFDVLPEQLFREHDFPVDMIVTPTEVINISQRLDRPKTILWNMLSNRRMQLSPSVAALHKSLVEKGEEVHLKEEDTDEEVEKDIRRKHRPFIYRFTRRRSIRERSEGGDNVENGKDRARKPRPRRSRQNGENGNDAEGKKSVSEGDSKPERKRKFSRRRPNKRSRILFTVRIGGIASTDRVRDLKNALASRNVHPAEIAWFGRRGFAYVHFAKSKAKEPEVPIELDTVVATLKDMKLGEIAEGEEKAPVIVEPAPKRDEQEKNKENGEKHAAVAPLKLPETDNSSAGIESANISLPEVESCATSTAIVA